VRVIKRCPGLPARAASLRKHSIFPVR